MAASDRPIVLFVHVPKAGGSTVNANLSAHFGKGVAHCQHLLHKPARLEKAAATANWLSGHVAGPRLSAAIATVSDRPQRLFACVRDPAAQIASHYNWLYSLRDRSLVRYLRHPRDIRRLCRTMRQGGADTEVILRVLRDSPILFDNLQSRYVLGDDWADPGVQATGLGRYDCIATTKTMPGLLQTMTGRPVHPLRKENTGRYAIAPDVFRQNPVADFLAQYNAGDIRLFDRVASAVSDRATGGP